MISPQAAVVTVVEAVVEVATMVEVVVVTVVEVATVVEVVVVTQVEEEVAVEDTEEAEDLVVVVVSLPFAKAPKSMLDI